MQWYYVKLGEDVEAISLFDGAKSTIKEGTDIRVYEGDTEIITDKGKEKIASPKNGLYLIETIPDKVSLYWNFYPGETEYAVLVESKQYADTVEARSKHLYGAKIPFTGFKPPIPLSEAKAQYYDKLNTPSQIPDPDAKGGKETVWILVAAGVAGALLAMASKD